MTVVISYFCINFQTKKTTFKCVVLVINCGRFWKSWKNKFIWITLQRINAFQQKFTGLCNMVVQRPWLQKFKLLGENAALSSKNYKVQKTAATCLYIDSLFILLIVIHFHKIFLLGYEIGAKDLKNLGRYCGSKLVNFWAT